MIANNHFTFIHLPKTGGSFVRKNLNFSPRNWAQREIGHHHSGYKTLPDDLKRRMVFGFVRNPWDWYVSWYHFMIKPDPWPHRESMFEIASDDRKLDFKTTITNVLGDDFRKEHLTSNVCNYVTDNYYTFNEMDKLGIGFYGWMFLDSFGSIPVTEMAIRGKAEDVAGKGTIQFGKNETLAQDLVDFIKESGAPNHDALVEKLLRAERVNESKHKNYREYYDDELKELVAQKESYIIEKFDYEF